MRLYFRFVISAVFAGVVWGQQPSLQTGTPVGQSAQVPTANVSAALEVIIPVVVRDKGGTLIGSASAADFSLQVDGHPQAIGKVDTGVELPLTVGVLVDTSPGQRGETNEERTATGAFFDQMIGAKDQGFVIQFAHEIELLQDATGSKAKLQTGLRQLGTAAQASGVQTVSTDDERDDRRSKSRLGTAMFDAVFLASDEIMGKQKGRKALVVLTDGNDRDSKERITGAIEAAQRTNSTVYAVYVKGEPPKREIDRDTNQQGGNGYPGGGYPGSYPGGGYPGGGYPRQSGRNPQPMPPSRNDDRKILDRLTLETGGRLFEVSKKESLSDIYAEIGRELRAQVRLRFIPAGTNAESGFHKVLLEMVGADKKKWVVEVRGGYYVGK